MCPLYLTTKPPCRLRDNRVAGHIHLSRLADVYSLIPSFYSCEYKLDSYGYQLIGLITIVCYSYHNVSLDTDSYLSLVMYEY